MRERFLAAPIAACPSLNGKLSYGARSAPRWSDGLAGLRDRSWSAPDNTCSCHANCLGESRRESGHRTLSMQIANPNCGDVPLGKTTRRKQALTDVAESSDLRRPKMLGLHSRVRQKTRYGAPFADSYPLCRRQIVVGSGRLLRFW